MSAQKKPAPKNAGKKPAKAAPKTKGAPKAAPVKAKAAPKATKPAAKAATKSKASGGKTAKPVPKSKTKPKPAKASGNKAAKSAQKGNTTAKPAKASGGKTAPGKPATNKTVKPSAGAKGKTSAATSAGSNGKTAAKQPAAPVKKAPAKQPAKPTAADKAKKSTGKTATQSSAKAPTGKTAPAKKPAPTPAASAAKAKEPAGKTLKDNPPAKSAPEKKAPAEASQSKPKVKPTKPTFVKKSTSSNKTDHAAPAPEIDAKTKELVLNARKRTGNSVAAKQHPRAGKGSPIVFTMDDVAQVLAKKQTETGASKAAENAASTAKTVAKKQVVDLDAHVPQEKRTHGAVSLSDILGFNPAAQKSAAANNSGQEVPRKWSRYHKALIQLREQVSNVLEQHTAETLKRSTRDDSGDLSGYGQHMADAGTDTFDRDFALSMVSSEQEALFEISEAIRRIHNGTYGVCEITGEPISAERLEAVPFTRYSLEGQKELEKTKRNKIQRGGVFTDNDESIAFEEDEG